MSITEDSRHSLFQTLVEVLGREQAATLMEHLPPVGWADVATKRDLDHLERVLRADFAGHLTAIDARLGAMDHRFDAMDHRFDAMDQRFDAIDQRFDAKFGLVDQRFELLLDRIDQIRGQITMEISRDMRTYGLAMLGIQATFVSLAVAIGSLL